MLRTALEDRRPRGVEDVRVTPSILCPVDFSDESLASLRRAMAIAGRSGARLAALHVADELLVHGAAVAYHTDVVVEESRRALHEAVDEIRRETRAVALEIHVHVVVGDPASEICRFCRRHDVDLIVMASHELHRYRRLLFGSVAEYVLRSAPAPILVIPPRPSQRGSAMGVTLRLEGAAASHPGEE